MMFDSYKILHTHTHKHTHTQTHTHIYIYIILPVVLYGYETWSHTLREGRRLRVIENRVLRRIFGPKRDEITEEWRKLHNEALMICTLKQILFL
jgi:hypothetical protein